MFPYANVFYALSVKDGGGEVGGGEACLELLCKISYAVFPSDVKWKLHTYLMVAIGAIVSEEFRGRETDDKNAEPSGTL